MKATAVSSGVWSSALVVTAVTTGAVNAEPTNLDFEDGVVGEVPTGWFAPRITERSGYTVELSDETAHAGERSAVVAKTRTPAEAGTLPPGGGFGNVMQTVDGPPTLVVPADCLDPAALGFFGLPGLPRRLPRVGGVCWLLRVRHGQTHTHRGGERRRPCHIDDPGRIHPQLRPRQTDP